MFPPAHIISWGGGGAVPVWGGLVGPVREFGAPI